MPERVLSIDVTQPSRTVTETPGLPLSPIIEESKLPETANTQVLTPLQPADGYLASQDALTHDIQSAFLTALFLLMAFMVAMKSKHFARWFGKVDLGWTNSMTCDLEETHGAETLLSETAAVKDVIRPKRKRKRGDGDKDDDGFSAI